MRSQSLARLVARPLSSMSRQSPRCYRALATSQKSVLSTSNVLRSLRNQDPSPIKVSISQFSSSSKLFQPSGTSDQELIVKLESEIAVEEGEDNSAMPEAVKEYLEESSFKLIDTDGQEEVELTKTFGDETIRVVFSIADVNGGLDEKLEDSALYDGEDGDAAEVDTEAPTSKKSKAASVAAAAEVEDEEEGQEEEYEDENDSTFPVRLNITIEKQNHGCLQLETLASDGMIIIENLHYHKDAKLATEQTAEADYQRRGNYPGPPFGNLDDDLQVILERYLEERGVDSRLAVFVPDYIEFKEQKEYLTWLKNVKGFVQG